VSVKPHWSKHARCQLGWWTAMTAEAGGDVHLFLEWLDVHGAIVISARSVERYAMFFERLPRRKLFVEDHPLGFVFRRRGRSV
jgi:hypothetical protein